MAPDDKLDYYNKGFLDGQQHSNPSPETKGFFKEARESLTENSRRIAVMQDRLEILSISIADLQKLISDLDKRYASKGFQRIVEKVLYAIAGFSAAMMAALLWKRNF